MRLTVAVIALLVCGCASTGGGGSSASQAKAGGPAVPLEFKGKPGETSETRYYNTSRSLIYEDKQLLRDRIETVDFTVQTRMEAFDEAKKILKFRVKTIAKDGTVDLHEMAFPELNEEIDYIQRGNGQILKAGSYPPQGLFYVPSLPMPAEPVSVGDTWTMEHQWISSRDSIPLKLEVVGILKDIVSCDKGKCADMEISGGVSLAAVPTIPGARFSSRLWGRLLFSLERGDVLWSEMRSQEEMTIPGSRTVVSSCMVSEMKSGGKLRTKGQCEPSEAPITTVPRL
jgi:hypothetical protein